MNAINKPVKRKTVNTYRDRSKLRPIVVSICPGDLIGFRYLGTRRTYYALISVAMQRAIVATAEADRREKAQARRMRKKSA